MAGPAERPRAPDATLATASPAAPAASGEARRLWPQLRLVAWYVIVLALVAAFLIRDSFSVPSFIYQNF